MEQLLHVLEPETSIPGKSLDIICWWGMQNTVFTLAPTSGICFFFIKLHLSEAMTFSHLIFSSAFQQRRGDGVAWWVAGVQPGSTHHTQKDLFQQPSFLTTSAAAFWSNPEAHHGFCSDTNPSLPLNPPSQIHRNSTLVSGVTPT